MYRNNYFIRSSQYIINNNSIEPQNALPDVKFMFQYHHTVALAELYVNNVAFHQPHLHTKMLKISKYESY